MPRGRLRPGRLDSRQSRAHPLASFKGLVARPNQGLQSPVRRRWCRLEEHLRRRRKRWWGRILSAGTGREPLLRTRNCAPLPAVVPRHTFIVRVTIAASATGMSTRFAASAKTLYLTPETLRPPPIRRTDLLRSTKFALCSLAF